MYYQMYSSPIGMLRIEGDDFTLTGLWFPGKYEPKDNIIYGTTPSIRNTISWLDAYFRSEQPPIDKLPLNLKGSLFQKKVWQLLLEIPYGKTVTYGDIANKLISDNPLRRMSAQAVGGAVGKNPISIIVPCHRVIGQNKQLIGYGGGLDRKKWLLTHEGFLQGQNLSFVCSYTSTIRNEFS